MVVVGVDPGLTGACAVLDHGGLRAVFDIPTMPIPGVGERALVQRKVDGEKLLMKLFRHCPPGEGRPTFVIEAVGTMGGANNAVQTQGSLMRSLGAIETVAECKGWPVCYVPPQTWKRRYGLIDASLDTTARKALALKTARDLYPGCEELRLAKHHNRAEAILIARWWRKVNVNDGEPLLPREAPKALEEV